MDIEQLRICKCDTCLFGSRCCWCVDKRKTARTYVDEYGFLGEKYIPRDIHYCANCRVTTDNLTQIVEELKIHLPPDQYHHLQTINDPARINQKKCREQEKACAKARAKAMKMHPEKYY